MSGICAVWRKDDPGAVAATLRLVRTALATTGDERRAEEVSGDVGVAMHAAFPSQQLFRTVRCLLACDAELLNERELADGLGLKQPTTAELLAALYESHGERFVEKLRGGFSVILWDAVEHRLMAAIDGFGIKRLVWCDDKTGVRIASRVDALGVEYDVRRINPRAIVNLLNFSSNLAPETVFTGIHRLLAGTLLVATYGSTSTQQFWDISYGHRSGLGERELAGELEAVVEQSVAAHCSDMPPETLGAFLSGGTDSSTVVGLTTRVTRHPVKAFSIGFEEPGFNELGYAETAARTFGSEHHTYLVSADDCLKSLPEIVKSFDEPYGNSSAVATYFCARLARQHGVTTLLAGDGGDELFGGNERYATDKIFSVYHSVPRLVRRGIIEPLASLPIEANLLRRARGYIRRANMPGVERMLSYQFLRTHALDQVFDPGFLAALDGYSVLDIPARHYAAANARDHLDRLLYVDMKIAIADNDLPKVTRMSELAGVRARFPFLDRSVAEFSGRIPTRLKVKGFQKRYLFKQAFRNLLPPEIIRKKKHGFGIPVALWMKSDPRLRELTRDTLLSARALGRGYFRREFIDELFRRHQTDGEIYYGDTLWTFLMLELWHRQIVDEPARVVA